MGRKANNLAGPDEPFAQRLRALLSGKDGNDASEEEIKDNYGEVDKLASAIGVDRSMVWHYYKGHSIPEAPRIIKIAKHYRVSVDWLLGLQEIRSIKPDIKMISKCTGLSDKSIKALNHLHMGRTIPVDYETQDDKLENQNKMESLNDGEIHEYEPAYHTKKIRIIPNDDAIKALNILLEFDYDMYINQDFETEDDGNTYGSIFMEIYSALFPQLCNPDEPEYAEYLAEKNFKLFLSVIRGVENEEYGENGSRYRLKMSEAGTRKETEE